MSNLLHINNKLIKSAHNKLYMAKEQEDGLGNHFTITYDLGKSHRLYALELPLMTVRSDIEAFEIWLLQDNQEVSWLDRDINLSTEGYIENYQVNEYYNTKYILFDDLVDSSSRPTFVTFTVKFNDNLITSQQLPCLFGGWDQNYSLSDYDVAGYAWDYMCQSTDFWKNREDFWANLEQTSNTIARGRVKPYGIDFSHFNYKVIEPGPSNTSDFQQRSIFQFTGNEYLTYIKLGKIFDIHDMHSMSCFFANIGILVDGCVINWYEENGYRFWLDYQNCEVYWHMFANSKIHPEFYSQFSQVYEATFGGGYTEEEAKYYHKDKIYLANAQLYCDDWTQDWRDSRWGYMCYLYFQDRFMTGLFESERHCMDNEDDLGIYVHGTVAFNTDNRMSILNGNYYGGDEDSICDFTGYLVYAQGFALNYGEAIGNIFFRPAQVSKVGSLAEAFWGSYLWSYDMSVDILPAGNWWTYDNQEYNTNKVEWSTLYADCAYMFKTINTDDIRLVITSNLYFDCSYGDNYDGMFDVGSYSEGETSVAYLYIFLKDVYFHDSERGGYSQSTWTDGLSPIHDFDNIAIVQINCEFEGGDDYRDIAEYYGWVGYNDLLDMAHMYGPNSATAHWYQAFDQAGAFVSTDDLFLN